jgi:uncharacterized protein (TIGR04255 family)
MCSQYRKPPITEATIGVKLAQPLERAEIDAVVSDFRGQYPYIDARFQVSFTAFPGASSAQERSDGFNMRDESALDVLVVGVQEIATSRLAPYPGWDILCTRALANYRRVRQRIGYKRQVRVGARFINRIDIPFRGESMEIVLSDYITVSPDSLSIWPDVSYREYFISIRINYAQPISVLLQTGIVPPALVKHMAIMLDIDASVEGDSVPQNEPDLIELLARLRKAKNEIFEQAITDKTRQLFGLEAG